MKLDFRTLSIWHILASWIPFKSKKYVEKWAKLRKDWISSLHINCICGELKAHIVLKSSFMSSRRIACNGISIPDLWDNLLNQISEIENMRNAEELKVWLDTQIL